MRHARLALRFRLASAGVLVLATACGAPTPPGGDGAADTGRPDIAAPPDAARDAPSTADTPRNDAGPDDAAADVVTHDDAPHDDAPYDGALLDSALLDGALLDGAASDVVRIPDDPRCPTSVAAAGTPCSVPMLLCSGWCDFGAPCDTLRCLDGTWRVLHLTPADAAGAVFECGYPPMPCDGTTSYCQQTTMGTAMSHTVTQACVPLPSECTAAPTCECLMQFGCSAGAMAYCSGPTAYSPGMSVNCVSP